MSRTPPTWKYSEAAAKKFAQEIRNTRRRLGLPQAKFARAVGVSQQKVSEWESGRRMRAVFAVLRLARVMQLKP